MELYTRWRFQIHEAANKRRPHVLTIRHVIFGLREVIEIIREDIKVNFMICAGQQSANHFKWPLKTDCQRISTASIISKISPPYPISSRHFDFHENISVT
ncbi:unnamed protein product [Larinioides sclopetarius]|uniref:Uncharacterized protein n=1 Tax=Larinioides sclopetarius TaxID=280406 RepID=A0AAV2A534_9ARAC